MVMVRLPDMMKPEILPEATVISKAEVTRSKMMLRVNQRWRMNVGAPNGVTRQVTDEGVGYAHSSVDTRKGKSGRSEGALLKTNFTITN